MTPDDNGIERLALRPREAARALGISERSLFSLTRAGNVPHLHLGSAVLYPVEDLRGWLAAQARAQRADGQAVQR